MQTYNFEKTIKNQFVKLSGGICDTYIETNMYLDNKPIHLTCCKSCGAEFISTTFEFLNRCPICGGLLLQGLERERRSRTSKVDLTRDEADKLFEYLSQARSSACDNPEDQSRLEELRSYLFEIRMLNHGKDTCTYIFRYSELELIAKYVDQSSDYETLGYVLDDLFKEAEL